MTRIAYSSRSLPRNRDKVSFTSVVRDFPFRGIFIQPMHMVKLVFRVSTEFGKGFWSLHFHSRLVVIQKF